MSLINVRKVLSTRAETGIGSGRDTGDVSIGAALLSAACDSGRPGTPRVLSLNFRDDSVSCGRDGISSTGANCPDRGLGVAFFLTARE